MASLITGSSLTEPEIAQSSIEEENETVSEAALPLELLPPIMEHLLCLGSRATLLELMLSCKSYLYLGLPMLYNEIDVRPSLFDSRKIRQMAEDALKTGKFTRTRSLNATRWDVGAELTDLLLNCVSSVKELKLTIDSPLRASLLFLAPKGSQKSLCPNLVHLEVTIPRGALWQCKESWRLPKTLKTFSLHVSSYAQGCCDSFMGMLDRSFADLLAEHGPQTKNLLWSVPRWEPDHIKLENYPRLCNKLHYLGLDGWFLPLIAELPLLELEVLEIHSLTAAESEESGPWIRHLARISDNLKKLKLTHCKTTCVFGGLPVGLEVLEISGPRMELASEEEFDKVKEVVKAAGAKKVVVEIEAKRSGERTAEEVVKEARETEFWESLAHVVVVKGSEPR